MPMHMDAAAMSQAAREAKTLRRTKPSVGFFAASSGVSSPVSNSKPALAGESSTKRRLRKNITTSTAAGTQKHHCQGKKLSTSGEK